MSQLAHNGPPVAAEPRNEASDRAVAIHPVDVLETENEFLVFADLPGVRPEDVDVRFEKGELAIHGRPASPSRIRGNGLPAHLRCG